MSSDNIKVSPGGTKIPGATPIVQKSRRELRFQEERIDQKSKGPFHELQEASSSQSLEGKVTKTESNDSIRRIIQGEVLEEQPISSLDLKISKIEEEMSKIDEEISSLRAKIREGAPPHANTSTPAALTALEGRGWTGGRIPRLERTKLASKRSLIPQEDAESKAPEAVKVVPRKVIIDLGPVESRIPKDDPLAKLTRKTFVEPEILQERNSFVQKVSKIKKQDIVDKMIDAFIEKAKNKKKASTKDFEERAYKALKKEGVVPETPLKEKVRSEVASFSLVFLNKTDIKEEIKKANPSEKNQSTVSALDLSALDLSALDRRMNILVDTQIFLNAKKQELNKKLIELQKLKSTEDEMKEIGTLINALYYIDSSISKSTAEIRFLTEEKTKSK